MNNYDHGSIGTESTIPAEIIDFLNVNKSTVIEQSIDNESTNINSLSLDEYESAMLA